MTTQTEMTKNLFKNWENIDKRVKYLRNRKMSENDIQLEEITKIILKHDKLNISERGTHYYAKKLAEIISNYMEIEIAGKEEVIKTLHEDIKYYRKDWRDQMIQDQGLDNE